MEAIELGVKSLWRYVIPIHCIADKWRDHPIYITAYGYFFGALFMGMGSIYYAATKEYAAFTLQPEVSLCRRGVTYDLSPLRGEVAHDL